MILRKAIATLTLVLCGTPVFATTTVTTFPTPTTSAASINLPHGTAPTSPNNGDCWTTTAGLFCQINGATVGPLISGTGTDCPVADAVGFVGDGTTDNASAWASFVSAAGSTNNICIAFRSKETYKFASAISVSLGSNQTLTILGNDTRLLFPSTNGLSVTYSASTGSVGSRITIDHVIWQTGTTGMTALSVNGNITGSTNAKPTILRGSLYTGDDYGAAHYWGIGRLLTQTSDVLITDEGVNGQYAAYNGLGIEVVGSSSMINATAYVISRETDFWLSKAVYATGYFQGVLVKDSNFVALNRGVDCEATTPQFECSVIGSQFNTANEAIYINNVTFNIISNNLIEVGAFNGTITGTGAISINATSLDTVISGNVIDCTNAGDTNWNYGIVLNGSGAGNATITGNYSACNAHDVVPTGGPQGVTFVGNRTSLTAIPAFGAPYIVTDATFGFYTSSGTIGATAYSASGTTGVTCSGAPTAAFASVGGIVTHCRIKFCFL
ncbi:MAG: hypothetical protein KGK11_12255 [Sphingomonadales bacterium]|nr:hypothetical protein [Sphingomonadales bacterium]